MQLCGDVTDEEIVKDNADLEEVLNLAAGRDLETTKKGVRAAIRETNKKKDEIGPRIDECRKGLVDINLASLDDARIDIRSIPEKSTPCGKKRWPSPPWTSRSRPRKNWQRLRQRLWP